MALGNEWQGSYPISSVPDHASAQSHREAPQGHSSQDRVPLARRGQKVPEERFQSDPRADGP